MKNFIADNSARIRGRRDVDEPEVAEPTLTEALPETHPGPLDGWQAEGPSATGYPTAVGDGPALPVAEEEPFVPKPRYAMGRSTKVLACVVLVAAGVFAGAAVQKQIDAGDRAARIGNFQGPGAGTGATNGNSTTGQGRRNGGTGTGGAPAGGAGTGSQSGAPAQGAGQ